MAGGAGTAGAAGAVAAARRRLGGSDARTRIDARLSPDPIRQTIATVQTTVQDIWKSLTETIGGGPPQLK